MDSEKDCVILDVRTQEEYDRGCIPGAIVISHDQIEEKAEAMLMDEDQLILVYCCSGRRSRKTRKSCKSDRICGKMPVRAEYHRFYFERCGKCGSN